MPWQGGALPKRVSNMYSFTFELELNHVYEQCIGVLIDFIALFTIVILTAWIVL